MNEPHIAQFEAGVSEMEMQALDVDLEHVWSGVTGALWSQPASRIERAASALLRSPALARALATTPSLVLSWLLASAAVFALGAVVAKATEMPIVPLLAPILAGVAVAFAYGAGADPAYEIARTMPTSARMILILRVGVVFVTNALLGAVAAQAAPGLAEVTMLWLLPMVAISMLALAVAVVAHNATIGGLAGIAVWSAIVLANQVRTDDLGSVVRQATLAQFAPLYVALAVISLGVVIWISGDGSKRREHAGWL